MIEADYLCDLKLDEEDSLVHEPNDYLTVAPLRFCTNSEGSGVSVPESKEIFLPAFPLV